MKIKSNKTQVSIKNTTVQDEASDIAFEPFIEYAVPTNSLWSQMGIKTNLNSDIEALNIINDGVSKKVLNKVMSLMGVGLEEMAGILHTTDRTLRRYDDNTILNIEQSERIIEIAKLYNYGIEVLGDLPTFNEWMNSKLLALNYQNPKSFLNTSLGIQFISKLLGRIEYGVYS